MDIWINPIGGFGDMLMLSGVIKKAGEIYPDNKYYMIRRSKYRHIFENHPAVEGTGYAPGDAHIISSCYWDDFVNGEKQRAYQLPAARFGVQTPAAEELYIPFNYKAPIPDLDKILPTPPDKLVIIAPSSDSPRKMMAPEIWHELSLRLIDMGYSVYQVGERNDVHIKPAFSLLGITTPGEVIHIIYKSEFVITVDNFIMHAAAMTGRKACVIWGPTQPDIYGYQTHAHIVNSLDCGGTCLGMDKGDNYPTPCPYGMEQCMNKVSAVEIIKQMMTVL